ncbi:MAG TPA: SDR family oxidoreductase [Gemmatimonadales bacterium]|nr:SDR family oxidoreductase [Gemmatimonadales bacterium]
MLFLTGATGLVGGGVLARMLRADPALRVAVLVRDPSRWPAIDRVTPVAGDLCASGLGLTPDVRAALAREVHLVVHAAADVVFSRPLDVARATNVQGTRRVLDLVHEWPRVGQVVYVSTAFVAGRRTGSVAEAEEDGAAGWVNAYEQSKWEAERLVRAATRPWLIVRPSTIVCDDPDGGVVTQYNAVHHAVRLLHRGLVPMIATAPQASVDLVPADYVAGAIAALAVRHDLAGRTLHLCAGAGALAVPDLLENTWEVFARNPAWRRKALPRPVLTDLATYALLERSIDQTGDEMLQRAVRGLSHFAPQLALPKRFETAGADALLGAPAPPVGAYWARVVEHLLAVRWGGGMAA